MHATQVEELSTNGSATTAKYPAVEPSPVIESADHEELPNPTAEGSGQETRRRAPSLVGVRRWVRNNLLSSGLAVALVVAMVLLTLTHLSLNDGLTQQCPHERLAAVKS